MTTGRKSPAPTPPAASSQSVKSQAHLRIFVASLAFLNGWGDVAMMRRFGCYCSKMTGNAVKFATAAGDAKWSDAGFQLAVLLSYLVGIVAFRLVHRRRRLSGFVTSAVAPAVLLAFVVVDLLPADAKWPAFVLSFASGIVNAVSSDAGDTITCMITGHLLTIGNSVGSALSGEITPAQRAGGTKSLTILLTFLSGVVLTAMGVLPSKTGGPDLPIFTCLGACYAACLLIHDRPAALRPLLGSKKVE